jgi:biopolymer transport protein ExbB
MALFPCFPEPFLAQQVPSALPTGETTLLQLLMSGGWVMLPLLLASIAATSLILYHFLTLRVSRIASNDLKKALEDAIRQKDYAKLHELTRKHPQLLARVMERTTEFLKTNPGVDIATLREVAQAEGSRQATSLNQQVVYLMDVGVLSPMLGLFGTVVGILRSFGSIAGDAATTSMRATFLAGGISQALVATAAGLIIGITAMVFYSYFRGRIQEMISELESATTGLMGVLAMKLKE